MHMHDACGHNARAAAAPALMRVETMSDGTDYALRTLPHGFVKTSGCRCCGPDMPRTRSQLWRRYVSAVLLCCRPTLQIAPMSGALRPACTLHHCELCCSTFSTWHYRQPASLHLPSCRPSPVDTLTDTIHVRLQLDDIKMSHPGEALWAALQLAPPARTGPLLNEQQARNEIKGFWDDTLCAMEQVAEHSRHMMIRGMMLFVPCHVSSWLMACDAVS
jgi:hypothetical protein